MAKGLNNVILQEFDCQLRHLYLQPSSSSIVPTRIIMLDTLNKLSLSQVVSTSHTSRKYRLASFFVSTRRRCRCSLTSHTYVTAYVCGSAQSYNVGPHRPSVYALNYRAYWQAGNDCQFGTGALQTPSTPHQHCLVDPRCDTIS